MWGEREIIYTYRYIVTTTMTSALRWFDERHFNVSVGSNGQSHNWDSDHCTVGNRPQKAFWEKGEPKRYRTEVLPLTTANALPLGQTGSRCCCCLVISLKYGRVTITVILLSGAVSQSRAPELTLITLDSDQFEIIKQPPPPHLFIKRQR